ncbi:CDP-glycerol glycerophosphotransferase family protein [Paenarthrobacter sp. NCHU4564]|uniref:CDP-glycerol glycerophosphotransferase family protein n=1 Tax=Paenarthrobacter sp. NCHU4564 TaxID=3451353 RepID=UPI003F9D319F
MPVTEPLLTIVLEAEEGLDRESVLYRRIVAARLRYENLFVLHHVREPLTTGSVARICESIETRYVVFLKASHQVSASYVTTMVEYLRTRSVYLAEPVIYTGALPNNVETTKIDDAYQYARDTDIFGIAFNVRRLQDALEAVGDVDRSALYLAYRLYWSIAEVKPQKTGFSVASDTKAAIGLQVAPETSRLVPLIPLASKQMRLHLTRYLALYLRGMRAQKAGNVSLAHLRDLIHTYRLAEQLTWVEPLQPVEALWIQWLVTPEVTSFLYKQLSECDAYLDFAEGRTPPGPRIPLYSLQFGGDTVTIHKSYRPRESRPGYSQADSYDFYSRPITPSSTIIFFDRPLQADDNAEHLYEYFTTKHPEFTEACFALNPKSPDWERLSGKGFKLIPIFTAEFYEKFLISDLVVSSQIYNIRYKGKSFANSRFMYLQHGIQLNDMTDWVLSKYFDVFVTTGQLEADYMRGLAPTETLNSGLPRFEALAREGTAPQHLLFMPTWRFNLHQASTELFARSGYFRAIDAVLTDPALLEFLEDTGRTLQVKLHPNVEKRSSQFSFSKNVIRSGLSYREAIASAEMVFTDYSSAVLDAAFMGTPIAYYHWDAPEFFRDQPYEGRVDYLQDGLGPVVTEHDQLITHIVQEQYLRPDKHFEKRRERFFQGVDPTRINAKIVERMLSL